MKATLLLVAGGTADLNRGAASRRETFGVPPRVTIGGPVRIGSHYAAAVGKLCSSWVGPDGTVYAEADIQPAHEQAFRDAVEQTRACSIEFVPMGEEMIEGVGRDGSGRSLVYRAGSTIEGVAVGVLDPVRTDSRVITMPAPAGQLRAKATEQHQSWESDPRMQGYLNGSVRHGAPIGNVEKLRR